MINRILIVGYGSIGKRHLRLARQFFPDADIRLLRHQPTTEVPDLCNGCMFLIDDAIAFGPQVAVIANPAPYHLALAQVLAQVGVHLLIEKPLSNATNGVAQLLQTCKDQGTVLLTGYNLRYLPSLQRFRSILLEGSIGKVLSVRCEIGQYLPAWRPDADYRQGVSASSALGGGALLELSHEIDYLRWLFGDVDWVSATLSRQSDLELDVEDTAHLIFGFLPLHEGRQLIGTLTLDFIRHDATRLCTAIGSNGSLRWDGITGKVSIYPSNGNEWVELFCYQHSRDDSYLAEWQDFINCVTGRASPMITGEDGLKVLQIIETARRSAASGCKVSVAPKASQTNSMMA
jgi:predicted dehydrogenase